MSTIVTRAGKGSALTYNEVDSNFTNLNTDKYQSGGALGTPASGTLTNCTGYTYANLSGTVPTWNQDTTGNAATVTNGVYTTGDQTIGGTKTFSSTIVGSINGNSATVTNGVYTSDIGTTVLAFDSNLQSFVNTFTLPTTDGTANQVLKTDGSGNLGFITLSSLGTVTSVDMTVPTGLSVSGNPITSSGTLAVTYASGYAIPTTAKQTEWDSAYTQRLQWDGGSTNLVASTGRTSLGATTVGSNLFTLPNPSAERFIRINSDNTVTARNAGGFRDDIGATTIGENLFTLANPSAITFPRFNTDNSVSALSADVFRLAIGAGTGSGTVTSVGGTGTVNGITLTGTVTSTGNLTLGGTLSGIGNAQLTNSSVTFNGQTVALGASGTITANTTNALTIGTGLSGTSFDGSGAVTIAIDSTVATLSGTQTLTNKTLTDPVITGTIQEDIFALTDGSTVDIDPANGSIQTLTLSSTGRTLTFTNMVNGEAITLMVNDGTAGTITTWNATFVNNGGVAPTLSTTGFTVVSIWEVGGVVYAAVVGNA